MTYNPITKDEKDNLTNFCKTGSTEIKEPVLVGSYYCTDVCPKKVWKITNCIFCKRSKYD
jgi:hypothetical protein